MPQNTLEPKNGDFVRYIQDLETMSAASLKGLQIDASESDTGMIKVNAGLEKTARREADQQKREALTATRLKTRAQLMKSFGSLLSFAGVFVVFLAIAEEIDEVAPLGMMLIFAGIVCAAQGAKSLKRLSNNRS